MSGDQNQDNFRLDFDRQAFIEAIAVPLVIFDPNGLMVAMNPAAERLWNMRRADYVGRYNTLQSQASLETGMAEAFPRALAGETFETEVVLYDRSRMQLAHPDPRAFWVQRKFFPLRNSSGAVTHVGIIYRDVSEDMHQREELERLQETIRALSNPVIRLWDGVLLIPLIGNLDMRRATIMLEDLLTAIVDQQAEIVIIDITGVPLIDTSAADMLLKAEQALRLVGATAILVGISSDVAQTLVSLGVNFSGLHTRANLQAGLEWALGQLGFTVVASVSA